jgi:hypothetical protein
MPALVCFRIAIDRGRLGRRKQDTKAHIFLIFRCAENLMATSVPPPAGFAQGGSIITHSDPGGRG